METAQNGFTGPENMAHPPPAGFNANGVEMDMSATFGQFAKALAAAQMEIEGADKDSVNPHFKTKYADLASVSRACRKPLAKNGIAVVQRPRVTGKGVLVETWLIHVSGEWMRGDLEIPLAQPTAQTIGSAITYGRRYGLAAMAGVAPDDDDDGNTATQAAPDQRQGQQERSSNGAGSRTDQVKQQVAGKLKATDDGSPPTPWEQIKALCLKAGHDKEKIGGWVKGVTSKTSPNELTEADVKQVAEVLANAAKTSPVPEEKKPAPPEPTGPQPGDKF